MTPLAAPGDASGRALMRGLLLGAAALGAAMGLAAGLATSLAAGTDEPRVAIADSGPGLHVATQGELSWHDESTCSLAP